jgi:tetratricopeptide (TPR) repeat protein
MPRDLKADQEMLRQVLALAETRDFARAADIAEQALTSGFEHPLLLNVTAARLEQEGKLEEALKRLQRAVELSPADVPVRNALALILQRLDRPVEALTHLDILLKVQPDLDYAHASRGNALIALGALGKARESLLRALELQPNNLAAEAALANIATHRGEHDEARVRARRVLSKIPGFPDSILSLAAAELASGSVDSAQMLVCQLLAEGRAGPAEIARANGLLGDVLDAAGRYSEAFDAYAACNNSLLQQHRRFAEGPGMLPYIESLLEALRRVEPARWQVPPPLAGAEAGATAHVFLLGFPRSGTTLLEVVLDGHPRVASLEEHELLRHGVMRFMREPVDFAPLLAAGEAELQSFREQYWREVRAGGAEIDGKVFVDKHPLHTLKLPLIARLFPRAKILFALRDPRDVLLSCFRRRFAMNPAMYQLLRLQTGAALYDATMRTAELARPLLGLEWREVRYELLAQELEPQLRAICDYLGLEWVSNLGDFAERAQARERATPSTAQLAGGLNSSGIGHWRHYRAALEPILPVLEPWVQRLGYPD